MKLVGMWKNMNMASTNIKLAVLFWLFSSTLVQLSFTSETPISEGRSLRGLFPKTHMVFENKLGDGLQAKINCVQSGFGTDKGEHVINDGESYEFAFTPNIFFMPWKCLMSYNGGTMTQKVYIYKRDWPRCFKHCTYTLFKDGVHSYNRDGKDDLYFAWENPHRT